MCIAPARACPTPGTTERARRHARMRATRSPSDSDALVALWRNISIIVATREPKHSIRHEGAFQLMSSIRCGQTTQSHGRSERTYGLCDGGLDGHPAALQSVTWLTAAPWSHSLPAQDSWLSRSANDRRGRMNGLRGAGKDGIFNKRGRAMEDRLLYRVPEVAVILNISRSKVYELFSSGDLESVKIHRSRLVRSSDLRAYVDGLRPVNRSA
jgi:excisionase family DNA binding protein